MTGRPERTEEHGAACDGRHIVVRVSSEGSDAELCLRIGEHHEIPAVHRSLSDPQSLDRILEVAAEALIRRDLVGPDPLDRELWALNQCPDSAGAPVGVGLVLSRIDGVGVPPVLEAGFCSVHQFTTMLEEAVQAIGEGSFP